VQPDLFIMVKDTTSRKPKESASRVARYVDRTVLSDGQRFVPAPSDISLSGGHWALRERAAAIVLAGGESSRMQRDKTLMRIHGRSMIEHVRNRLSGHFAQILVSANDPEKYAFLGVPVIEDRIPGNGPMMGIASALAASAFDLNLVAASDIPDIDVSLAHRMIDLADGYDAVVPRTPEGHLEPLFAVYRRSAGSRMRRLLAEGERRIRRLFESCRTRYVDLPSERAITNLNTIQEYLAYVGDAGAAVR
jgi:molybdopterin-guanine dinucleotide biosynthesis protein A